MSLRTKNTYADAKIDLNFTQINTTLNNTITSYNENGGRILLVELMQLFKCSIQRVAGHKKVIVIMTDGIANLAPISP